MDSRQFPDLTNTLEWNLVARETAQWETAIQGYGGIKQRSYVLSSRVCLVGLRNPTAPARWRLGGWATMMLPFLPSSTSEFPASIAAARRTLRLGLLNLVVLPSSLPLPVILYLTFPYWHLQMQIEVWRYDGRDVSLFDRLDALDGNRQADEE